MGYEELIAAIDDDTTGSGKAEESDAPAAAGDSLASDADAGIATTSAEERRRIYGTNYTPSAPRKSLFQLFVDTFDDATVQILMAAAVVSLAIGIYGKSMEVKGSEGVCGLGIRQWVWYWIALPWKGMGTLGLALGLALGSVSAAPVSAGGSGRRRNHC